MEGMYSSHAFNKYAISKEIYNLFIVFDSIVHHGTLINRNLEVLSIIILLVQILIINICKIFVNILINNLGYGFIPVPYFFVSYCLTN